MTCAWCEREDGLKSVEIEPAVTALKRTAQGELFGVEVRAPIYAWACPDHQGVVFDPSPNVQKVRRRKARGFQQLTFLDNDVNDVGQHHHGRDPSAA